MLRLVGALENLQDPGLPPHRPRRADEDPRAEKRAERQVAILFVISIIGTVLFFVGYFGIRLDDTIGNDAFSELTLGMGTAFAMLGIGVGIVHWAKTLMPDHEIVEDRHEVRTEKDRRDAEQIIGQVLDESGISRRPLIRNTLIGAGVLGHPACHRHVPGPGSQRRHRTRKWLRHTMWDTGVPPHPRPERHPDQGLGCHHWFRLPRHSRGTERSRAQAEEKAKAVVLLMRLNPARLHVSPGREDWNYNGIVAYSKICTHVGCPVALYEQQTHHLLCPCHQSTFDLTQECKVIFGPAAHALAPAADHRRRRGLPGRAQRLP